MTAEIRLGDDVEENYALFVEEAIDTGCVWSLQNEEGWALCPSIDNDDIDVMPLWSQPEYAKVHCREEWASYEVVPIALEELIEDWCPGLHGDVILLGLNWNDAMEGIEKEPLDLVEDIDSVSE